jgi:hypothetical protein
LCTGRPPGRGDGESRGRPLPPQRLRREPSNSICAWLGRLGFAGSDACMLPLGSSQLILMHSSARLQRQTLLALMACVLLISLAGVDERAALLSGSLRRRADAPRRAEHPHVRRACSTFLYLSRLSFISLPFLVACFLAVCATIHAFEHLASCWLRCGVVQAREGVAGHARRDWRRYATGSTCFCSESRIWSACQWTGCDQTCLCSCLESALAPFAGKFAACY